MNGRYPQNAPLRNALFVLCAAVVFLLVLCSGCGASSPTSRLSDTPRDWHPYLRPYLKTFVYEMGTVRDRYSPLEHELPAVLTFAEMPAGLAGYCFGRDALGEVYIDISFMSASTAETLAVVAHELAHCVLRAGHDPEPDQLLSPQLPADTIKWSSDRWVAAWDRLAEVVP